VTDWLKSCMKFNYYREAKEQYELLRTASNTKSVSLVVKFT